MIKKFLAVATLILGSLGVIAIAAPAAGAAPVSCMGPGTSSWIASKDYVYNCSIDGNHVVMDMYQGAGYWPAAVEFYWPSHKTAIQFQAGALGSTPARIWNCPIPGQATGVVIPNAHNKQWGYYPPGSSLVTYEGVIWFPHGPGFTAITNNFCSSGLAGKLADLR